MKAVLCLLALSAAVAIQGASVRINRANLNIGAIYAGDRLLARTYLYRPAVANTIQSEDFTYRGNASARISFVQGSEVGYTQYANIFLVNGGLGQPNVTLRAQSQRGWGYYYLVDVWGR